MELGRHRGRKERSGLLPAVEALVKTKIVRNDSFEYLEKEKPCQ